MKIGFDYQFDQFRQNPCCEVVKARAVTGLISQSLSWISPR